MKAALKTRQMCSNVSAGLRGEWEVEGSNPGKLGLGSSVHAETGDEALPMWNEEVGLSWDFWRATILL